MKLDEHLANICIKTNRKLTVLTKVRKYLDFTKVILLCKSFFESLIKYCPLTWMFYSRKTNNRIHKRHKRALRLVYNDCESTSEDLLVKDGSFTLRYYNIQTVTTELYKVYLKHFGGNCLQEIIMAIALFLYKQLNFLVRPLVA